MRPRCYCGHDVLIEKLEKFTIQNVILNAAIEESAAIEETAAAIEEQSCVLFSIAAPQ